MIPILLLVGLAVWAISSILGDDSEIESSEKQRSENVSGTVERNAPAQMDSTLQPTTTRQEQSGANMTAETHVSGPTELHDAANNLNSSRQKLNGCRDQSR